MPRMWTSLDVLPSETFETLVLPEVEEAEVEATDTVEIAEA